MISIGPRKPLFWPSELSKKKLYFQNIKINHYIWTPSIYLKYHHHYIITMSWSPWRRPWRTPCWTFSHSTTPCCCCPSKWGCFVIDLQFNFRFIYMNCDMISKVEGVGKYPILLFHKYIFCTKTHFSIFSDYKSQEIV